jgi:hypothetical protein
MQVVIFILKQEVVAVQSFDPISNLSRLEQAEKEEYDKFVVFQQFGRNCHSFIAQRFEEFIPFFAIILD